MIDQNLLIKLLNQPGTHSGTMLGDALGVSRVAVQKKIQSLIDNGLPINAVSGKGYSLANGIRLLDDAEITSHLKKPDQITQIDVLQSIGSTNSYLLSQPVETNKARVCIAEAQTSGRGRRGNDWKSAPYRNVMMSLSWGFNNWPATITGLGLAVALSITECLNEKLGLEVSIKWPNDLMVGDDKLAGVLIDVAGESSGACNVVIGLGLNVHQTDWSTQQGSAYQWKDLAGLGVSVDRNLLLATLVDALTDMLSEFSENGFSPMVSRWNDLSTYAGRMIRVGSGDDAIEGQMMGVDSSGALIVEGADGVVHQFSESTVSVRLVA